MRGWAALALLTAAPLASQPAATAPITIETAMVVARFPHDPQAFTQGLLIDRGELFESTGQIGRSSIRKVDLASGKVLKIAQVPAPHFGEGIAAWKGQVLSLTWQQGAGFRWDRKSLKQIGRFTYSGEGWGLTSAPGELVMSDGTDTLRFIDPARFTVKRIVKVTIQGRPLRQLNELEWVNGQVLANVWMTPYVVRIDPGSGKVVGIIDVSALLKAAGVTGHDQVPNGIAWDSAKGKLYMTGKEWPWLYEVRLERTGAMQ